MSTTERRARMGLSALAPLGAPAIARAVAQFGAIEVWDGLLARTQEGTWSRRAAGIDIDAIEQATEACGARFVIPGDEEWPAAFADLDGINVGGQEGVPIGIWVRGGSLNAVSGGAAIVGARASTRYGEVTAMSLAADLAMHGHVVVSGLAFGIDAAAHRGALGAGGPTVGMVACGLDEPYPSAHAKLTEAVTEAGALVSELPPGYRPSRHAFLARNRLIAAFAEAVVVVEAALRSGAKNTASWANALSRPVLAVPGPVTSSMSATPHRLIRDAEAVLATSAEDIIEAISPPGTVPEPDGRGETRPIDRLPRPLYELREAIRAGEEVTAAELARRTGQHVIDAMAGLAELVEGGWVEEKDTGGFTLPGRP